MCFFCAHFTSFLPLALIGGFGASIQFGGRFIFSVSSLPVSCDLIVIIRPRTSLNPINTHGEC
jgi:hypothetical protein